MKMYDFRLSMEGISFIHSWDFQMLNSTLFSPLPLFLSSKFNIFLNFIFYDTIRGEIVWKIYSSQGKSFRRINNFFLNKIKKKRKKVQTKR